MADNTVLPTGVGGDTCATDDIGGIKFQRVKLVHGIDGVNDGDVSTTNGLPTQTRDVTATGTITALNGSVKIALNGQSGAALVLSGTWVATLQFEASLDDITYFPVNGVYAGQSTPGTTTTANGLVRLTPSSTGFLRVTATGFTSGTVNVSWRASAATGGTFLNQSLTAGTNFIGKVGIDSNSLVSTANSTTANLAGAAVFTGAWEDVSEYSTIAVNVFSSHASATDGLSLQQSSDGINADITDVYSIPAATGKVFKFGVAAKFYRLVYTNGATLTTSLRIQTIHSKATKRGSSVRPQDARTNDNDFEEVLAGLMGYNGASWDRIRATIANGLLVDVTRGPTLIKAVQGVNGFATQDLKDAGRVIFSAATVIAGVTAVTVEALLTMVPTRDGVAAATATTQAVTSGKRLRLEGIMVGLISTGASVLSGRVALRMNPSGAAAATSPIIAIIPIPSGAALAQAGGSMFMPLPDGIEFSGTHQFGLTQVCNAATGTVWASVVGFEY